MDIRLFCLPYMAFDVYCVIRSNTMQARKRVGALSIV